MASTNCTKSVKITALNPPITLYTSVMLHVTKSVNQPGQPSKMPPSLMAAKLTVAMTKTLNTRPK